MHTIRRSRQWGYAAHWWAGQCCAAYRPGAKPTSCAPSCTIGVTQRPCRSCALAARPSRTRGSSWWSSYSSHHPMHPISQNGSISTCLCCSPVASAPKRSFGSCTQRPASGSPGSSRSAGGRSWKAFPPEGGLPMKIPFHPDAITAAWLTDALPATGTLTHARVTALETQLLEHEQGLTGQLARLSLGYDADETNAPRALIAKFSAPDPQARAMPHAMGFYEREVRFYEQLA